MESFDVKFCSGQIGITLATDDEDTPGSTKEQIKGWNAWCDLDGSSLHP